MTTRLQIVLALLVLGADYYTVRQIHRRRMSVSYSLLWLAVSVLMLLMLLFPNLVYNLARLVGIDIPFNMLLLGFVFFTIIMMFYFTVIVSHESDRSRNLTQQLALLEQRVRELEGKENGTHGHEST